jgi:hypothetical protein
MQNKPQQKVRREIDAQINENLKRAFDEAASEPLPSRFSDLLEQLRQSEQAKPNE